MILGEYKCFINKCVVKKAFTRKDVKRVINGEDSKLERALNGKLAILELSLFLTTNQLRNFGQVGITFLSSYLKITFYICDLIKESQRRRGKEARQWQRNGPED